MENARAVEQTIRSIILGKGWGGGGGGRRERNERAGGGVILETPKESEKGTDNDENAGFGCAVIYPRERIGGGRGVGV